MPGEAIRLEIVMSAQHLQADGYATFGSLMLNGCEGSRVCVLSGIVSGLLRQIQTKIYLPADGHVCPCIFQMSPGRSPRNVDHPSLLAEGGFQSGNGAIGCRAWAMESFMGSQ